MHLFFYPVKVKPWSEDWLVATGAYPGFCSMKWLEVFLLPLDGMLVLRRSPPRNFSGFPIILPVPIYTSGRREALWELSVLPKNTTPCPRPGLKPGPLAPESSALTMRPPCLPFYPIRLAICSCQSAPIIKFSVIHLFTFLYTILKVYTLDIMQISIFHEVYSRENVFGNFISVNLRRPLIFLVPIGWKLE